MTVMHRRSFLATPLAAAIPLAADEVPKPVYTYGDGIPHTPAEYAQLLANVTSRSELAVDSYSRGGIVETLENRIAGMLGKEAAVWFPTGTLANQVAVR